MPEREKTFPDPGTRPGHESSDHNVARKPADGTRPPDVHEEKVEAASRKSREQENKSRDEGNRRPPDEPGAEGQRSARADEDTYD